jgi:DnaJ-class molecular chaperone
MPTNTRCDICHGEGYTSQYHDYPCIECDGKGFIKDESPDTNDTSQFTAELSVTNLNQK